MCFYKLCNHSESKFVNAGTLMQNSNSISLIYYKSHPLRSIHLNHFLYYFFWVIKTFKIIKIKLMQIITKFNSRKNTTFQKSMLIVSINSWDVIYLLFRILKFQISSISFEFSVWDGLRIFYRQHKCFRVLQVSYKYGLKPGIRHSILDYL